MGVIWGVEGVPRLNDLQKRRVFFLDNNENDHLVDIHFSSQNNKKAFMGFSDYLKRVGGVLINDTDVYFFNEGMHYYKLGQFSDALKHFNTALHHNPNYDHAWVGRGHTLAQLNQNSDAITSFNKAIEINPNNPEAWVGRGIEMNKCGEPLWALENFDMAIKIDQNNVNAWQNRADSLVALGRHSDANDSLEKAKLLMKKY